MNINIFCGGGWSVITTTDHTARPSDMRRIIEAAASISTGGRQFDIGDMVECLLNGGPQRHQKTLDDEAQQIRLSADFLPNSITNINFLYYGDTDNENGSHEA